MSNQKSLVGLAFPSLSPLPSYRAKESFDKANNFATEEMMQPRVNFARHSKSWSGAIKDQLLAFVQGCFEVERTAQRMLRRMFF